MLARFMLTSCVRPSVRLLSVTSRYCIETTGEIQLVFGTDASLLPYCVKGNASIFNIRVVLLEVCRKLWTKTISPRQVDRVVNKTRRQSSLLPYLRRSTCHDCLLCTDVDRSLMLQLQYFDLFWICCTTCSCSCAVVDKISINRLRRDQYYPSTGSRPKEGR